MELIGINGQTLSLESIEMVQEVLKSTSRFPEVCTYSAILLEQLGLIPVIEGSFTTDLPNPIFNGSIESGHSWANDVNGVIVELTGTNFNPLLDVNNQFPDGVVLINPDNPLYERYKLRD